MEAVLQHFMFRQGSPQQEVAYVATLLWDSAHDWFMTYLRRHQGRYPQDWATLSAALVERFGSRLREKQALTDIMAMCQNRRSVHEYAAVFENCVGRLSSYDEATLMQIFVWGLGKDLAEKVSTAGPRNLLSEIGLADDIELAIKFADRPPMKGGAAAASSTAKNAQAQGGQPSSSWRGRGGFGRWGAQGG